MTYRPKKGLNSLYVVLGVPRLLEVVVVPVVGTKELDSKMDMKKGEVVRMGEAVSGAGGGEVEGGGGAQPAQTHLPSTRAPQVGNCKSPVHLQPLGSHTQSIQ